MGYYNKNEVSGSGLGLRNTKVRCNYLEKVWCDMKFKRICAFAAAAVLTAACAFSGCSKNDDKTEEKSAQQSTASQSVQSAQPSAESKTESKQQESYADESSADESSVDSITPRVCEITDDAGNKMYTMGTIHLADESVMHMPGYFETAFAQSDAVAVECDISLGGIDIMSLTKLMYTDKTTIKDHVSADDYEKVKSIVSSSPYYNQMYDYIKPMMWASLAETTAASEAGLSESYGVDNMLISRAGKEGKEILELEGTQQQMELIGDMPEEIQNFLFHEIAAEENYLDGMKEQLTVLYDSWKKGEELASEEEGSDEQELTEEQEELLEKYNTLMLYDRNEKMAEKAEEYISSGKTVFMAVGSAHFYGDKGIYKLLEDKGYHIRQLTDKDAVKAEDSGGESTEASDDVSQTDPAALRAA